MNAQRQREYLDWQAATDDHVAHALTVLLTAERMARRWDGLPETSRRIHGQILSRYISGSCPPLIDDIDQAAAPALADLEARDLIFLEDDKIGAYPFAPGPSGHRVLIGDRNVWAVCIIDAFGVSVMVNAPVRIESRCPVCDADLEFHVSNGKVFRSNPTDATVWAGVSDTQTCAARTQCRTMLAFCRPGHLEEWRQHRGAGSGFRFTPEQAAQAGAAIFGPFLAERLS